MKWLREPLLHFLIVGALFFAAYEGLHRGRYDIAGASRTIRITANEVTWLKETWMRQRMRPPTEDELKGLVSDYVMEELLSREAHELQLDINDTIVRRRLAQKMNFLLEDTARLAEPSGDELLRIYQEDPRKFQTDARISFTHIYFNPGKRGENTIQAAHQTLVDLVGKAGSVDTSALGDSSLLEPSYSDFDFQSVSSLFGQTFADAVFAMKPGGWQGPVESGYGPHLVRVIELRPPEILPFEKARETILANWHRAQREKARETYFDELFRKYDIQVDETAKPLLGPHLAMKEKKR